MVLETKGANVLPKNIDEDFKNIYDMINNLIGLVSEEKDGSTKTVDLLIKDKNSIEYAYNKLNNICSWLIANKGYKFE